MSLPGCNQNSQIENFFLYSRDGKQRDFDIRATIRAKEVEEDCDEMFVPRASSRVRSLLNEPEICEKRKDKKRKKEEKGRESSRFK